MFCLIPQGAFTSKKSKIRASISSITLIVMQGPCNETFPFGDFHEVRRCRKARPGKRIQSREVQGPCAMGKAHSKVTAALISFIQTSIYQVPTMCQAPCQNSGLTSAPLGPTIQPPALSQATPRLGKF